MEPTGLEGNKTTMEKKKHTLKIALIVLDLLIILANSFDPDQEQQNDGPDLDRTV